MKKNNKGLERLSAAVAEVAIFERELQEALQELAPKEKQVLELYYGLGGQENSLEKTGEIIGVSRERVRQIKGKALRMLRSNLLRRQPTPCPQAQILESDEFVSISCAHSSRIHQTQEKIQGFLKIMGYDWEKLSQPIESLEFSKRTLRRLRLIQAKYLFDLVFCNEEDLLKIYGFGQVCLDEIRVCLKANNLDFLAIVPRWTQEK